MIEDFCRDFGVDFAASGGKHTRPGWVQLRCPFCTGSSGWHLGYNLEKYYFNCWRCGWHPIADVLMLLAGVNFHDAKELIDRYKFKNRISVSQLGGLGHKESGTRVRAQLPPGIEQKFLTPHKHYLEGRGFDPVSLIRKYKLKCIGKYGLDFKHRILIPVVREGRIVSFHGRDVTGKSKLKYKACVREDEAFFHRDTLYNLQNVPGKTVVIVEGQIDAWRFGDGAVATFGINYTKAQILLLKNFSRRFVAFDGTEEQAIRQADKLATELSSFAGLTEIVDIGETDPGDMDQEEANEIMRELMS